MILPLAVPLPDPSAAGPISASEDQDITAPGRQPAAVRTSPRQTAPVSLRHHFGVASRAVAAIVGAYAASAAVSMALARSLPMRPAEATTAATLIGALLVPALVIWAFAARSALRAWVGILLVLAVGASIACLLGPPA
jgi:Protein of unknown function (DUF3649)